MSKIIWLTFIIFSGAWAHAQDGNLRCDDAIREAELNSPEIKRLEAASDRVSWGKTEALSTYLPHLSLDYDHYFQSRYLREGILFEGTAVNFPAAFPQDNFTADVSLTVFDGFEGVHKYRAAGLNSEASQLELERARFLVEESVRTAFYQALAAQKYLEVSRRNVKTLEDHLAQAKLTERTGYGTPFDVLRIEATLEEARAEQEEADNNVYISRGTLNEVMGLEKDDSRPLQGELPILNDSDLPENLAVATVDRADVQAQMKRDAAAAQMAAASRSEWSPTVSVFAEEQYYKFGSFDPLIEPNSGFQNASLVGVRLRWNLFDGGYTYAHQRQAASAAIEAQSETRKALIKLPKDIDAWKRKFRYSVSLYRARLRAVAQFQESVRLAAIGVKAGARTHMEMLDAELDLFRAQSGLVKAQADAIEAMSKLELAVGRKIWQGPKTVAARD